MGRAALLLLILASVSLNAAAQIALRAGARHMPLAGASIVGTMMAAAQRPGIWLGLGFYVVSLCLWIIVLSRTEASFAYPFLGLGFVIVALVGFVFLGETLSAQKLAGIGIIALGIAVLAGS